MRGLGRSERADAHNLRGSYLASSKHPAALAGLPDLGSHGSHLANFYGQLYGKTKLSDLSDHGPDFIFNSTSLQSGELMRFSKAYIADWRIGTVSKCHLSSPTSTHWHVPDSGADDQAIN